MKVLITGGAGYIGSHAATLLLREGYEIVVYDNLSTGDRRAVPDAAQFVLGDIRDGDLLRRVLRDRGVEAVIHFAAKLVVPESVERPWDYYETNLLGGLSVLKSCVGAGIKHLIFSSTAAVYGDSEKPVQEGDPAAPVNPYGASKRMVEVMLERSAPPSLGWISLRYFNVAGAALDGRNGSRTKNATLLIKVAAEVAAGKRDVIRIFGSDYPTPDGTCIRDFIHVEDLAEAHVAALRGLVGGHVRNEIYNCGYGHGSSVKEVVEAMKSASQKDFKSVLCPRRPGDPASIVADAGKIRKALSWRPTRDSLELICKTAYEWETKNT